MTSLAYDILFERSSQEFINYVDSFYGQNDPIYPMVCVETGQPLNKYDIARATHTYIERIEKGDLEHVHYSWGGGDSLDRERVRDILLEEYSTGLLESDSLISGTARVAIGS